MLGLAGCLLLALTLPATSVVAGAGVVALGLLGRWVGRRPRSPRPARPT